MDTTALYIGYIVLGLIAVALIRKYETRNMYKACKVATQFLISKGVSEENTLQEAKDMIEKYRKRYKITED